MIPAADFADAGRRLAQSGRILASGTVSRSAARQAVLVALAAARGLQAALEAEVAGERAQRLDRGLAVRIAKGHK